MRRSLSWDSAMMCTGRSRSRAFFPGRLGQLGQDVDRALVEDRVDRVETQAVDVELADPVPRVLDEMPADALAVGAVEVDGRAPGRLVAVRVVRAVLPQVVALGPEVVVDHVEHDAEAVAVGGIDQAPEAPRPAIGGLRCEEVGAVVAPVARAGELADRHELDRGDPEVDQLGQVRDDGLERPRRREGRRRAARRTRGRRARDRGNPGRSTERRRRPPRPRGRGRPRAGDGRPGRAGNARHRGGTGSGCRGRRPAAPARTCHRRGY